MTLESREKLTEFKHKFRLPNKEFTEVEDKEIKVTIFKDNTSSIKTMRGQNVGKYNFTSIYFETTIPKYLKDYLINRLPDYDEFKKDYIFRDKINRNFISKIRHSGLTEIEKSFNIMTQDALFLSELDKMEKLDKFIFIKSSSTNESKRCNYNHADLNKLVGVDFHYFVCYEKENNTWGQEGMRYYGLRRKGNSFGNNRNKLPLITSVDFKNYTKVKWTQEREDYLEKMQNQIIKISDSINNYVETLNDDNFEIVMKNQLLLEEK